MRKYSALLVFFFLSVFAVQAQTYANGQAARAVFGQTNFTAADSNPSQQILGAASGLAFYNGVLYVADSGRTAAVPNDSRIVAFPTSQIPGLRDNLLNDNLTNSDCYLCGFYPSFSLGQSVWQPPSTNTACPTGVTPPCFYTNRTQNGLANATGVATDGHYFAVADTDNNRVLIWNEIPTTMDQNADVVVGQTSFTSFKTTQVVDQYSLRGPQNVWIQNGELFVADTQNNRVLIWTTMPTQNNAPANIVLGQPNFTTDNQPPPTAPLPYPTAAANQLLNPGSVTSDGTHLYVSDLGFNRVLIWNSIPTVNDQNADVVVGQPDMTQTAPNNPNVCSGYATGTTQTQCQTSLNFPRFVLSNGTHLFVADGGNDRVLIWDHIPTTNGAPADQVLGQVDFQQDVVSSAAISIASTAIDNTAGVDLLPTPQGIAYDPATQNLFVSDAYSRRVQIFTPGDTVLVPNQYPIVNWASEIIRQEGVVAITAPSGGTITKGDTVGVTIAGTAYTYTLVASDASASTAQALDNIAQGLVKLINAGSGDPNVTATFAGTGTGGLYLSSKGTSLAYDSISLAVSESDQLNELATASGAYLSSGTAATGATGMLVEINGTNLSDSTVNATLDGTSTIPNTLGGVQVYMDGYACPILKASPTQIVTQIPYGYGDRNSTSVYVRTVHNDGSVTVTNAIPVYIAPANPGIFDASNGQSRPWPIAMAFHQPGNPTAVVSIDGSVTAGNVATVTIAGVAYNYTVVAADTLQTITQNLVNLIKADSNVTPSLGGAFTRIVLTAKQAGAAGNGITVTGTASTNATVTVTAYTSATCCVVTPNSPILATNPAAPGELITITGVGLGGITDLNGNVISTLGTGVPYAGTVPNTAQSFVTATMGGTTAQVIFAELPTQSYGIYNIQMVVPSGQATNSATTLNIAQNAFISNTVTIPVGPPVLYVPVAAPTTISEWIDAPAAGSVISGSTVASGWALNSVSTLSGVNVYIDGALYGAANIGNARPDVCAVFTSPSCSSNSAVGWSLPFDSTQFADGQHTISIAATSTNGEQHTISQTFSTSNNSSPATNPLRAAIDSPGGNVTYRGAATFSGWATNDNSTVVGVQVYIDGGLQGSATYGNSRPDVCAIFTHPPNCPLVGWIFQFDTNKIPDGSHTFVIKSISANGQTFAISQPFQVANWTGASTTHAVIDAPSLNAGAFSGLMSTSGWAVDSNSAVSSVYISVDGVSYGAAAYGVNRPDVCAIFADAGCPDVGWNANIDTTLLADGQHTLTITVNLAAGQSSTYTRTFSTANYGAAGNPILTVIDHPANGASVSGVFAASGWAISSATDTVTNVSLLIDGKSFGNATYGGNGNGRPDVCAIEHASPNCPNVGWNASLNSGQLSNGTHTLEATVSTAAGYRASINTTFTVANPSTGPGHIDFDVPTGSSNPFLGRALFNGWALNDNGAVSSLSVTIDGVPYGTAARTSRPDVCAIFPGHAECPNVGWSFGIDTTQLPDGQHTLGLTENVADGSFSSASISFTVANYSTANPMKIDIDWPPTAPAVFGSINMSGWVLDANSQIGAVYIAIDGVPVGTAAYGETRADVCTALGSAPGCPNVGWSFGYDTNLLPNGVHTLDVTGVTTTGQSSTGTLQFTVAN